MYSALSLAYCSKTWALFLKISPITLLKTYLFAVVIDRRQCLYVSWQLEDEVKGREWKFCEGPRLFYCLINIAVPAQQGEGHALLNSCPTAQLQFIVQYLHWCLTPALAVFNGAQQNWTFNQTSNLFSTLPPGSQFVHQIGPRIWFQTNHSFFPGMHYGKSWFGWKMRSPRAKSQGFSII